MGNRKAKQRLIEKYGKECFIEKLHLRHFDKSIRYTSRKQMKLMKQLTYHHIQMKKDGGKATVENGALLSTENHQWFHRQSKEKQEEMNKAFQEYKKQYDELKVEYTDKLETELSIKGLILQVDEKGNIHIEKVIDKDKIKIRRRNNKIERRGLIKWHTNKVEN